MTQSLLRVTFDSPEDTSLSLLSRTLEDFDTYLELVITLADERRDNDPIPGQWRHRRFSRLPKSEQVLVSGITRASPLVLEIAIVAAFVLAAVGKAAWPLVQSLERLVMLPGQYKLQQLAIQEKKLDIAIKEDQVAGLQTKDDDSDDLPVVATGRDPGRNQTKRDPGDPKEIRAARASEDLDHLIIARRAESAYLQSLKRLSQDLPIRDVTFEEGDEG